MRVVVVVVVLVLCAISASLMACLRIASDEDDKNGIL